MFSRGKMIQYNYVSEIFQTKVLMHINTWTYSPPDVFKASVLSIYLYKTKLVPLKYSLNLLVTGFESPHHQLLHYHSQWVVEYPADAMKQ